MALSVGLAAMGGPPWLLPDLPYWSRATMFFIGLFLFIASVIALIKPNWFWHSKAAVAQPIPNSPTSAATVHPASRYFSNPSPNGRLDLGMAIYFITDISEWQRQSRDTILLASEQGNLEKARLHLAVVAAGLLRGQAETNQLTIFGRPKDSVIFESIHADTWGLCEFRIVPDVRMVLRAEVIPQHENDRQRLVKVLSCDSFQLDIEQFTRLWPGMRAADEIMPTKEVAAKNPTVIGADEMVPLADAARLLYERAREKKSIWAHAAERLSGSKNGEISQGEPDEILDWMATYMHSKAVIYGCRPPSAKIERIDDKHGQFECGALIYKTSAHAHTGLEIAKHDVLRLMEW